jgi:hypothetical protein
MINHSDTRNRAPRTTAFLLFVCLGTDSSRFADAQITQQLGPPFGNASSCDLNALSGWMDELLSARTGQT